MGKTKKKFNWKAREVSETKIDRTAERKIKVELNGVSGHSYDESNALVLPSAKRKTKVKKPSANSTKLLSKRQRKELEKVVERKKKKENRSALLESLAQVQLPAEVLNMYTPITEVQTKGLKRRYNEDDWANKVDVEKLKASTAEVSESITRLNSVKGSSKRRRLLAAMYPAEKKPKISDPNVVTFETSSEESSDEDNCEIEANLSAVKVEELDEENDHVAQNEYDAENDVRHCSGVSSGESESVEKPDPIEQPSTRESDISAVHTETTEEIQWQTVEVNDKRGVSKRIPRYRARSFKNKVEFQVTDINPTCNDVCVSSSNPDDSELSKVIDRVSSTKEPTAPIDPKCTTSTEVKTAKRATYVHVDRSKEIQEARLKLPILAEEQVIMETINENPIVIIAGETGSGKTTQVPQFLYEAGYTQNGKMIGITEPRRVAAISMAKRIGEELNLSSDKVSYLIRFEGNVTPETEVKFMTDGVLLKEIQADFLLSKYSVVILDEAHERSVYTDILMGLLSRIVPLRLKRSDPLKLIIMSATLKVEEFLNNKHLFKSPPPVIKVESRQFPVTIHFNKKTDPDYLRGAYKKVCRIHTQLPEGGVLVFLTGQQEVNTLVNKLRKAFPMKNRAVVRNKVIKEELNEDDEDELDMKKALQKVKKKKEIMLPNIDLDNYSVAPNDDTELDLLEDSENDDDDRWGEDDEIIHHNAQPMWVLPLYSILPSYKQAKVFAPPPEGTRLCVVATNVAETSLTIPGVKYVVDVGKVKTKLYDKVTGVTAFSVVWTSKAAANQRAGRAGRTGPGHCYRLYSSAVFNDEFEGWSMPEMQRRAVDDLVLQMKSLGIQRVVNFPFPSPPDRSQLKLAEEKLTLLGAIQPPANNSFEKDAFSGKLTALGESMARFPVAPRFAKMLCLSHQHNLLEYTVAVVAAMSVQEVLLEAEKQGAKVSRAKWAGQGNSLLLGDAMVLLRAIGAAEYANSHGKLEDFCTQNNIRQKAIVEVRKIRLQLTNEINLLNPDLNLTVNPQMAPPDDTQVYHNDDNLISSWSVDWRTKKQSISPFSGGSFSPTIAAPVPYVATTRVKFGDNAANTTEANFPYFQHSAESQARLLRQIILAGLIDRVARKTDQELVTTKGKRKPLYNTPEMEDLVTIHSSSALCKSYPEWVVYQEIYETNGKTFMRGVTAIEPEWLPVFALPLCHMSQPLEDPPPRYDPEAGVVKCRLSGTFGRSGWELPLVEMEYPPGLDRYRWFAVFFLDGSVCPKLATYKKTLLSSPQTMTKTWAKLQTRTEFLLKSLVSKEVDSKKKLLEVWKTDSRYLLSAYQRWQPDSLENELAIVWPPVDEDEE